jgi:hypothetical protein
MFAFFAVFFYFTIVCPSFVILCKPFQCIYQFNVDSRWAYQHCLYTILGVNHVVVWNAELINDGFILANHRCVLDHLFDCYVTKSIYVSRTFAVVVGIMNGLLSLIEQQVIVIRRGVDKRDDIYKRMVSRIDNTSHKRICFWPEGTRNNYTTLNSHDEVGTYLKYGLLKEIYSGKRFPVQLCISSNKDVVFNEKKFTFRRGVTVNTMISKPIHPNDFATEQAFYDEIKREWYDCWVATHSPPFLRSKCE